MGLDPDTGEFVTSPRESRKARQARNPEASKRGRRSKHKGRKGDLQTVHDLEAAVAGITGAYVEDCGRKEAGNVATGVDQIVHLPAHMEYRQIAVQTKVRVRPSLRQAWAEVVRGQTVLGSTYAPVCRLEWSYTRQPHLNLAVLRGCDLDRLLHAEDGPHRCFSLRGWKGSSPPIKRLWGEMVAAKWDTNLLVLRLELTDMEAVQLVDWRDYLTLYREAVTR